MQQSTLPLARNTDPETSHEAADNIEGSGKSFLQRVAVYNALQAQNAKPVYPHPTSAELARWYGLDRYMVGRRLSDLEHMGMAEKVVIDGKLEKRKCAVNGSRATTWKITGAQYKE